MNTNNKNINEYQQLKLSKQFLILLLVLINATASFLLWTHEFKSKVVALSYLKYSFRDNALFPLTSIPVSFFTSLSLFLVVVLFAKKQKIINYLAYLSLTFLLTILSFYFFRYALVHVLNSFFKMDIIAYLLALFIIVPLYSWLVVLCINQLLIKTKKVFILWLWMAIVLSIPLSMLCMLAFHSDRPIYSSFILDVTQKGYPVFWINLTIAFTTYFYFKTMKRKIAVSR